MGLGSAGDRCRASGVDAAEWEWGVKMVRNRPSRRRMAGWATAHLLHTVRAFGALGQRRRYMAFFSIQERVRPTAVSGSWTNAVVDTYILR